MLKQILMTFAVLLLSAGTVFAQSRPTLPFSYNRRAPGARSLAMGNAGVAVPNTPEVVVHNPAALGFMNTHGFEITGRVHTMGDTSTQSFGLASPQGDGIRSLIILSDSAAVSWKKLSNTNVNFASGLDSRHSRVSLNAVTLSVGERNSGSGFNTGLNIGYIYGNAAVSGITGGIPHAGLYSAHGFYVDMAMLMPMGPRFFTGVSLRNIAAFVWWDRFGLDQPPFSVALGTAFVMRDFVMAVDYERFFYRFGNEHDTFVRAGIEYYLNNFFALRAGFEAPTNGNEDDIKYTYGIGLRFAGYDIDFALQQFNAAPRHQARDRVTEIILSVSARL
ncbi:MAG: hypothetical protein FWC85_03810 [Elusimicrobia bacterium]|nr:hypothetical protein [Elusimicrobiota bacterium]